MRRILSVFAAFIAFALPGAAARPTIDPARLESFVDGAVRQAQIQEHVAGLSVAVVGAEGPLLLKGYGMAGGGRGVDAGTLFRVGSISKTITWIAIMQLAEQGRLKLDDPINQHLPVDLRIPDEGYAEPIRIRNLMAHNAGFEDATLGVNVTQDVGRILTLSDYLKRYRVRRVRPPGVLTVYSNYGAALAGAIVEHETGMAFPDYAETKILRPLGVPTATFREPYPLTLTHAGFPGPLAMAAAARVSSGFRYANGSFVEQSWEFLPHMAPAGALSASATDMSVYMHALLTPEDFERAHVLRAATVLAMRQPLFANDPRLGSNRHGFWQIPTATGEFAFGHNGAMAFQQASMGIYPERGLAIFVAVNSASFNPDGPSIIATLPKLILNEFFAGAPTAKRVAIAADELARYAGCYRPLRRPYHHTESGLFAIGAIGCIPALQNSDLRIGTEIYEPIGNGVFARHDLNDRIAFGMRDGRMILFNYDGSGPLERVGYFQTPDWLSQIGALALIVAAARLVLGIIRLFRRRETRALALLDGLSIPWLAAIAMFGAAAVPWLADFSIPLLIYPGPLLPLACWLFLGAALATVAVLAALAFLRPRDWTWGRWVAAGLTLGIYGAFAVALQSFSLLGFSGW